MILKKCLFGLFVVFYLNTAYADNIAKAEPPFDVKLNKDILMNYFNEHKLNKMIESIEEFV